MTVGKITDVSLQGYHAGSRCSCATTPSCPTTRSPRSSRPASWARSSSSWRRAGRPSPNPLKSGDVIPMAHTGQNPEVEQVLGALSLLLNGGGVGQLQTITRELNKTLHGREGEARSVLHQIRDFSGQLDRHKHDIVQALDALDRLSTSLNHQRDDHRRHARRAARRPALDQHPAPRPGADAQGARAPQRSRHPGDQPVQGRHHRHPAPAQPGARAGSRLRAATSSTPSQVALTYPFVDEVVGRDPQVARNLQMGDYTNLSIKLDLSLDDRTAACRSRPGCRRSLPTPAHAACPPACRPRRSPRSSATWPSACRAATSPARPARRCSATRRSCSRLIAQCKKNKNDDNPVCQVLNSLPSMPTSGPACPP